MENESEKVLLKDQLFNKDNVRSLARLIKEVYPKLNDTKFENDILKKFPELELKERIYWIRHIIEQNLSDDYEETLNILLESLKNQSEKEDFVFASFSDFVAENGCNKKYLDKSLAALGVFTKYCSAEFAVRCFINAFPEETFIQMQKWSVSKNIHQRRLASEGLRPKLPWAKSINFDYKAGSTVLDNLFYDENRYVTRSVANHLNDISKFDPDFVVEKLGMWKKSNKQDEKEMEYIIQHSLRTSVKKGHINTLNFLGYNPNLKISVIDLKIRKECIILGDTLEFSFTILSKTNENLIIDYKIIYPTPHNRHSEKVFKIKKTKISDQKAISVHKKHIFKKTTTKKLYSGNYKLEIQINGKVVGSTDFYLKV